MSSKSLTHVDQTGAMHMVDISEKPATKRVAVAQARVRLGSEALSAIREQTAKKGDVLAAVRLAGIQAAKRTADLIPLCHPLALSSVRVDIEVEDWGVDIQATTETIGPTGVEMEAMTAASVAALTLYDMLKAVERGITIESVCLLEKSGGRSGTYQRA